MPDLEGLLAVSVILALVCTILLFVLVLPEKNRANLNAFFRGVADICNFRALLLEKILKFCYIFLSLYVFLLGFFMLFVEDAAGSAFLMMILGPIVIRIVFEASMMFIILVKNTNEINKKIKAETTEKSASAVAAVPTCPHCGAAVGSSDSFCQKCGQKI